MGYDDSPTLELLGGETLQQLYLPDDSGADSEDVQEVTVAVPKRDCTVSLVARNRFSASIPAKVRLRWQAAKTAFLP
ncbi:MAG: hypothetical protein PVI90_04240, partial [Desulfobacteraceae bacterium]